MARIDLKKVLWKIDHDVVTVLLYETGTFFELNKVGSTIWKCLAEGLNNDEIVSIMLKTYDVSREKVVGDVDIFIDDMIKKGLLNE